jgi:hypothetical protein
MPITAESTPNLVPISDGFQPLQAILKSSTATVTSFVSSWNNSTATDANSPPLSYATEHSQFIPNVEIDFALAGTNRRKTRTTPANALAADELWEQWADEVAAGWLEQFDW